MSTAKSSRIANFFRMTVAERVAALGEAGWLSAADQQLLAQPRSLLTAGVADKMIENVIGVFGLPVGVALNFMINGEDYVLPMVVEEPSIVAGLSGTAKLARATGGFSAQMSESLLIGQIQVIDLPNADQAEQALTKRLSSIIDAANQSQPNMVARGGGVVGAELHRHRSPTDGSIMLVVHLLVDTKDAMGANLVNSMCEACAPLVEEISGGTCCLRILSNLTDRAIAQASVEIGLDAVEGRGMSGELVRDRIIAANDLALVDPYRAATHNKGIMNGVDAIAVATGNDWRAIESGAHAFAALDGYSALTQWACADNGNLVGTIRIPVKIGTVGGSLETNPTVALALRLLGNPDAEKLAGIFAAVGLAQNLAALRSLATNGIQQNHMKLHARSVASTAQVPAERFEEIVAKLIDSGEIKVWKAKALMEEADETTSTSITANETCGKLILFGEHSAVHGHPAIAVPLPAALFASAEATSEPARLTVPAWGIDVALEGGKHPFVAALHALLSEVPETRTTAITVDARIPHSMGLGGSAALAVCVLRAVNELHGLGWDEHRINELAFQLERASHGNPSGVDNSVAAYGAPLTFQRTAEGAAEVTALALPCDLPLVVGLSSQPGATSQTVAHVQSLVNEEADHYNAVLAALGAIARDAQSALALADLPRVGRLMNLSHAHLNTLQVSTRELDDMVATARASGALGAKLTGGGGGGAIIALAPQMQDDVAGALKSAGYEAFAVTVPGDG